MTPVTSHGYMSSPKTSIGVPPLVAVRTGENHVPSPVAYPSGTYGKNAWNTTCRPDPGVHPWKVIGEDLVATRSPLEGLETHPAAIPIQHPTLNTARCILPPAGPGRLSQDILVRNHAAASSLDSLHQGSKTSLPTVLPDSMSRCASPTFSSGYVVAGGGVMLPSASQRMTSPMARSRMSSRSKR